MTKSERTIIEDSVWDCTIGTGKDHDAPKRSDLRYIEFRLNRTLDIDDLKVIFNAWRLCLQSMAQP